MKMPKAVPLLILLLVATALNGCWWWPHWPPSGSGGSGSTGGSSASGGSSGSSGTGGSVMCQDGDSYEITCVQVPGGDCGEWDEPLVVTLPIPPDDYCEPAEWPVNECVLEVDRVCGPPEQYAAQTINAELWDGGDGTMSLVIVDTLNHGVDCTSDFTCTTRKL
jgi:hypothetical protein